jgi:hypothetical protein
MTPPKRDAFSFVPGTSKKNLGAYGGVRLAENGAFDGTYTSASRVIFPLIDSSKMSGTSAELQISG